MNKDGNEEVLAWKSELESKKEEFLKKKTIIETRLNRYKLRLEIASTIQPDAKSSIYEGLKAKVISIEKELENFNNTKGTELREIDAILSKLERKLN